MEMIHPLVCAEPLSSLLPEAFCGFYLFPAALLSSAAWRAGGAGAALPVAQQPGDLCLKGGGNMPAPVMPLAV